jgi:ribosomal subunit interface protein
MKTNIKAANITLTPSITDYVERKLVQPIAKFIDANDTSVMADVEVEKTTRHHHTSDENFRAEINLRIGKLNLRAEAENQDLFAAIDEVKDEIIRELTSSRKRQFKLLKRGGQKIKDMIRGLRN